MKTLLLTTLLLLALPVGVTWGGDCKVIYHFTVSDYSVSLSQAVLDALHIDPCLADSISLEGWHESDSTFIITPGSLLDSIVNDTVGYISDPLRYKPIIDTVMYIDTVGIRLYDELGTIGILRTERMSDVKVDTTYLLMCYELAHDIPVRLDGSPDSIRVDTVEDK